ncbi:MAG: hypothetical protein WAV11_02710 [Minisyncoccia bacterium]
MTKIIENKINILETNSNVFFATLICCIAICFSTYMFFLGSAFLGGVERQEISRQFEITNNAVHSLETQYLALRNSVNEEYVKSQGFVSASENKTRYISLSEASTALTLNTR